MLYKPHDYQKYAQNFIMDNPTAAVFLDMGLGKTVITLSAIWELTLDRFDISKTLVIAPLRVARDTWPNELKKWQHLKGLKMSVIVGNAKERIAALNAKADIYVVNRENVEWLVENGKWDFDMVVIDELSSFKNGKAKRFKALRKVRPFVQRIVGLTGTPSPNGLMDLWAEIGILDMGKRLGRYISHFRNEYFVPDKRNQMIVFSYKPKPDAEDAIYNQISDICISMKAADYLKMPELTNNIVEVKMEDKEKAIYKKLKDEMVLDLPSGEIDAKNAAGLTNKLLQMANGAVYAEGGKAVHIHDKKLDALEDLIEAANGKPVLVAYWFKHDIERLQKRFAIRKLETSADFEEWNKGEIPVAAIHPASAGHGLNLQAGGSALIWFGLTWSLELYQQTNARLWRQGQKQAVVIHHIVTKGTIDERILKALKNKNMTQVSLIEAVKADLGGK